MAKRAGLLKNDTWAKYPRQMLRSRVVSEGVRTVFPSATGGLYVPEEVADFDDPPARAAPPAPRPIRGQEARRSPPLDQPSDAAGEVQPPAAADVSHRDAGPEAASSGDMDWLPHVEPDPALEKANEIMREVSAATDDAGITAILKREKAHIAAMKVGRPALYEDLQEYVAAARAKLARAEGALQ